VNISGETHVKFIFLSSRGIIYVSGLATNYYEVLPFLFLQRKIKVLSSSWQARVVELTSSTLIPKKIVNSDLNLVTNF
jgi:hypothetical protein